MDAQETKLLKSVDAGFADAIKEAGDAGDPTEAAGLDEAAAVEAADAGEPPSLLLGERELAHAIRVLESGPRGLTEEGVVALAQRYAKHEKAHAHKLVHRRAFARGHRFAQRHASGRTEPGMRHEYDLVRDVPWRRSTHMNEFRWDLIERFYRHNGGHVTSGVGYYYSTFQVRLSVEGTPACPAFVLQVSPPSGAIPNPVIDSAFDYAIGETEPDWLGGEHVLNSSDTNLQTPGMYLYPNQLFIIEAVRAKLKAFRIQYYPVGTQNPPFPLVDPVTMPTVYKTLMGSVPTWDREGLFLPPGFFNRFNDHCELAQAIAMVTTLYFAWNNPDLGGDKALTFKLVERLDAVPGVHRHGVQEASGAGNHLDLQRGFVWCLDKTFQGSENSGGNGLFSAQLHQTESFSFPFAPIPIGGSPLPVLPLGAAIEIQLTLYGTSLIPSRDRDERAFRRRT